MRNIVIFMLILNVGYLLWILLGPENENRQLTEQALQSRRDGLVLVTERESEPEPDPEIAESSNSELQTQ